MSITANGLAEINVLKCRACVGSQFLYLPNAQALTFGDTRKLQKLDILIGGDSVDALSIITDSESTYTRGREICKSLKEVIPRQMFEVVIQAAIGSKIIARESVRAYKKNVTAKCDGGDITRKRKLWAKQKEGKKRMKQIGKVEVPQEAFLALFKVD